MSNPMRRDMTRLLRQMQAAQLLLGTLYQGSGGI